jgi:hypothetical protein
MLGLTSTSTEYLLDNVVVAAAAAAADDDDDDDDCASCYWNVKT